MYPDSDWKVQRFATDQAFEEGWSFYVGPDTGKKVAGGGGPASLAAASFETIWSQRHHL